MAETVHLFLQANGVAIHGDSKQTSPGRKDSIECLSYEQETCATRESGDASATSRREHRPIIIRKRVDKASPLLMQALCENQVIEAEFKFFRPAPGGDGNTEQFYTVVLKNARLNSMKQMSYDCHSPSLSPHARLAPIEEIGIVYHTIEWTFTDGGIQYVDNWHAPR